MRKNSGKDRPAGGPGSGNGNGNGKPVVEVPPAEAAPRGHVVLPPPDPKFDGVIGRTYKDSKMGTFPVVKAPPKAPNVLLVLIDDCGFGQWGTFGGQIPTPNLDRLAKRGLRYTRFHTTALCSPTRAALLTGRNHHSCASGNITELGDQLPRLHRPDSQELRDGGGDAPPERLQHGVLRQEPQRPRLGDQRRGPFDRWPTSRDSIISTASSAARRNQWQPALYEDTRPVEMEIRPAREGNYTLNEAWPTRPSSTSTSRNRSRRTGRSSSTTRPARHTRRTTCPKEWIAKYKGKFDQGWDKYREEMLPAPARSWASIPADTKLTPRPDEIPAWTTR